MPPKTRIPRERVEEAAFEIAREKGMSAITATGVAERLRCSTQPVYWWFGTMDSLKAAVRRRAGERYKSFVFSRLKMCRATKRRESTISALRKKRGSSSEYCLCPRPKRFRYWNRRWTRTKKNCSASSVCRRGWTTYVRIGCIQPCGSSPTESRSCSQPAPRHFRKGRSGKC